MTQDQDISINIDEIKDATLLYLKLQQIIDLLNDLNKRIP